MSTLTGVGQLLRLAWRRDRIYWLAWIVGLAILMPATARMYDTIIPPGTDPTLTLEPLRSNPTMLALLGPAFDIYTKGGFVFWRVGGFASMFAGMMTAFGVIRATRAEEEPGRLELLRSGAIGRHAPLAAGIIMGVAASLALAILSAALLVGVGLDAVGALAAGAALASTGLVFTGIAAVCAQVSESARATRALAVGGFFGGMFLARMVVDGGGPDSGYANWNWAIPMEWGMLIRPFAVERWWVLALPLALTTALVALAVRLETVRDHGAGLRPARLHRATARGYLHGPWGLTWRLSRTGLIGWTVGILVGALGTGSIVSQLGDTLAANPQLAAMLEKLGGSSVVAVAFNVAMLGILGTIIAVMAVSILTRMRSEEQRGHTEVVLATATSRWTYAASFLAWAVVLPALLFVAVGALVPLPAARLTGTWSDVATYAGTAAVLLPGLLLVVGIAMMLIGWLPRLTNLVWAVIGWTLFTSWFAELFNLPTWLLKVQPWGYLSHPPRDTMNWLPFTIELILALALIAVGVVGYRRRNIPA